MKLISFASIAFAASVAGAQAKIQEPTVPAAGEPVIVVEGQAFYSWQEYLASDVFRDKQSKRCGTKVQGIDPDQENALPPSDCSYGNTTISSEYNPTTLIEIPVVVHVIMNSSGTGNIPDSRIHSQIDILNEDFRALAGTNGANGTDTMIQFFLATEDPNGAPTNGITRSTNNNWFNDNGQYWNSLAWDTNRYCNIYTNSAQGFLGYVPDLPQGGIAGSNADRIVCLWSAFGRNAPIGPPYNQGRTATHEVGHYFGLYHTFDNGCGTISGCYTTGDRICDTNRESSPNFGCGNPSSCGSPDPVDNYMDYSDDLCMEMFTPEQTNRMRCSITHYREDLPSDGGGGSCNDSAQIASRNAGGNPNSYTANAPIVGGSIIALINVGSTGHNNAFIMGYAAPANLVLGGGQTLLVDVTDPGGELLGQGLEPGPSAVYIMPVPNDPSLCGFSLSTQGVHVGGTVPFALSNAQDMTVGM